MPESSELERGVGGNEDRTVPRRALDAAFSAQWLAEPWLADVILRTAMRQPVSDHVQAAHGSRGVRTNVEVRNGLAFVPIRGAIFPKANIMTEVSGATSLEMLRGDLEDAATDPDVDRIVLEIDSGGGAVAEVSETARKIREIGGQVPVSAYVIDRAGSAAYWLAAAAEEVITADTASVGSVGVVAGISKTMGPGMNGVQGFEIVSSNARFKRPDPEDSDDVAKVRQQLDGVERVFIDALATYRGVGADTVRQEFGQGAMVTAADAEAAGMIDGIESYADFISARERAPATPQQTSNRAAASAAHSQSNQAQEEGMSDGTEAQAEAQTSATNQPQATERSQAQDSNPAADVHAQIFERCTEAGFPSVGTAMVRRNASLEQVDQRLSDLTEIRRRCQHMAADGVDLISNAQAEEIINSAVRVDLTPDQVSPMINERAQHRASADDAVQSRITPDAGGSEGSSLEQAAAEDIKARRERAKARGQTLVTFDDLEA